MITECWTPQSNDGDTFFSISVVFIGHNNMYTVVHVGIKEREISPIRFDKNTSGTAITFIMYCVYTHIVNHFCIGKRLQYFFC